MVCGRGGELEACGKRAAARGLEAGNKNGRFKACGIKGLEGWLSELP